MITVIGFCSTMLLAQIVFQSYLLGTATEAQPYGTLLTNCKSTLTNPAHRDSLLYISQHHWCNVQIKHSLMYLMYYRVWGNFIDAPVYRLLFVFRYSPVVMSPNQSTCSHICSFVAGSTLERVLRQIGLQR